MSRGSINIFHRKKKEVKFESHQMSTTTTTTNLHKNQRTISIHFFIADQQVGFYVINSHISLSSFLT